MSSVIKSILPLELKRTLRRWEEDIKGRVGMLPDFLIIGAQRSGTTSLYEYLVQHPNILPAFKKELHFFDKQYPLGLNWYRSRFPSNFEKRRRERRSGGEFITGEATPCYFIHPQAPKRISRMLPAVKLIVMFRNPIDRAFSQYRYNVKKGREPLSFEEAIACEEERLAGEVEKLKSNDEYVSFNHQHYSYLLRGRYAEILPDWFRYFGRDYFFFIKSEDFFLNPDGIYLETLKFLNMPLMSLPVYETWNQTMGEQVKPETRNRLAEYFAPWNQKLQKMLGRDFGW